MTLSSSRRLLFGVLLLSAVLGSCSSSSRSSSPGAPTKKKVIVLYPGPLKVYTDIVAGFNEGLAKELPADAYEVIPYDAKNDEAAYTTLVSSAVSERPYIIAPIATKLSKEAVKNGGGSRIIFLGVTDPLHEGLIKTIDSPDFSTGVSDRVPLKPLLTVIRQVTPRVKKLGLPYSPNDPPAMYSLQQLQSLCPALGFILDARPITNQDELDSIVRDLVRVNDAVLVGADTGMFKVAAQISKIAMQARKPFYAGDPEGVDKGAIVGVTIDYREVGRAGATLAARVIKGEKVGTIPVTVLKDGVVVANQTSLDKLGIRLNEEVRQQVKMPFYR